MSETNERPGPPVPARLPPVNPSYTRISGLGMIHESSTASISSERFPRSALVVNSLASSTPEILLQPPREPQNEKHGDGGNNPSLLSPPISKQGSNFFGDSALSDMSEMTDIVRGPVQELMAIHYILSIAFLVITHFARWTFVYAWSFPIYIYNCFCVLEISRMVLAKNDASMAPLYLSFIPFIHFHLYLRGSHVVLSFTWYISIMTINLQNGIVNLGKHVVIATVAFLIISGICLVIEKFAFNDQSQILSFRSTLYSETVDCNTLDSSLTYRIISPGNCQIAFAATSTDAEEFTFGSAILLAYICIATLQEYIHAYAAQLLERSQNATVLAQHNKLLKSRMHSSQPQRTGDGPGDGPLDLESPIGKAIRGVQALQMRQRMDADTVEALDYVMNVLSSNRLFAPDLEFGKVGGGVTVDGDVRSWLNTMLAQTNAEITESGTSASRFKNSVKRISSPRYQKISSVNETKLSLLLETIDDWDFDLFELDRITNCGYKNESFASYHFSSATPLYHLSMAIFERYDFFDEYEFDEKTVRKFFKTLENAYNPLPYHSALHASDVLQAMHFFISNFEMIDTFKRDEILAAMIAAAVHDVDHSGFTNAYLIASSNPLALRYNDTAVLENHHCAKAFEIMTNQEGCNFLGRLPNDRFRVIRANIVSMVLATDMSNHFEFIAKFKIKVNSMGDSSGGPGEKGTGLDFDDAKDRQLILNIFIKCGDISNAAKSLSVCKEWASRIMEEFFMQGDEERKNAYPVSMFMDRKTTFIPKCQVGFVDYIVLPLYEALGAFLNAKNLQFIGLKNLISNRDFWKE
ncbi:High affinity cAMP-specific 3',5'-cyclic phosphodiesterase 7A [Entophlyctis luteolus]|nr:High affinity cAMP-specific 3',5'-cyclic phosphodiesterase 7A [Entophlyctis luteolus]KAJ3391714.1 High affinity cAMP-specific 3',5'-cyclic phosphodiesterase 7A [Entophlyctis sp. JEL0112]